MEEKAIEILNKLKENGYTSFVVGGYVRDKLLERKSSDIDICTSATPKELLELFEEVSISEEKYGSVVVLYKGYKYDVTTFRKEIKYESNRRPVKIKYIKDIKKDLLRRDFTINTFCIDEKGEIIDLLGAYKDLKNKTLFDGTLWLKRNKIKYSLEYEFSDTIERNTIIKQNIEIGENINVNETSVTITISKGKAIKVPNLLNMKVEDITNWVWKTN